MTERRVVLRVLLGTLAAVAAPARAASADLEALFALFAAQGERRTAFVERRYSVLFRNPPETRGTLYFKPPALLEREVVSPHKEKVRIDAETATLHTEDENGKVTERKASARDDPATRQPGGDHSCHACRRSGDIAQDYLVTMKQPLPRWRIELTPIAPIDQPAGAGVSQVAAGDRGEVERIEFTETSGDRTEIVLNPAR